MLCLIVINFYCLSNTNSQLRRRMKMPATGPAGEMLIKGVKGPVALKWWIEQINGGRLLRNCRKLQPTFSLLSFLVLTSFSFSFFFIFCVFLGSLGFSEDCVCVYHGDCCCFLLLNTESVKKAVVISLIWQFSGQFPAPVLHRPTQRNLMVMTNVKLQFCEKVFVLLRFFDLITWVNAKCNKWWYN